MSVDTFFVASWINPVPSIFRKKNCIQAMQAVWRSVALQAQTLIAETSRNNVCPQKGPEKMTFGIAVACSVKQYIGSLPCYRVKLEIPTMADIVAYPLEAMFCYVTG